MLVPEELCGPAGIALHAFCFPLSFPADNPVHHLPGAQTRLAPVQIALVQFCFPLLLTGIFRGCACVRRSWSDVNAQKKGVLISEGEEHQPRDSLGPAVVQGLIPVVFLQLEHLLGQWEGPLLPVSVSGC